MLFFISSESIKETASLKSDSKSISNVKWLDFPECFGGYAPINRILLSRFAVEQNQMFAQDFLNELRSQCKTSDDLLASTDIEKSAFRTLFPATP